VLGEEGGRYQRIQGGKSRDIIKKKKKKSLKASEKQWRLAWNKNTEQKRETGKKEKPWEGN